MASQKISVTVKYLHPGTQPPIYLAGSFSDPAWDPQEMQYTIDDQGEYAFTKEVEVDEGKEYQYKFRVGEGDWWLLNEGAATVTDNMGNRNNLLIAPLHKQKAEESEETKETNHSSATKEEATAATPTVVIEKMDAEPRHGDDFGADASIEQKDAHNLRAPDAEPDYVIVRSEAHTPELASNAAEVADSAATLDREAPTPPMSDEEAGRTGYRRMSHTPIPQVAMTAAEVADIAAILDKDYIPKIEEPRASSKFDFDFDSPNTPGSGASTPPEDRAPLFAHECLQPPTKEYEQLPREPLERKQSNEEAIIDTDDPLLEEFPCERSLILERVRTSQTRLAEDPTSIEGIPLSPVVRDNYHPERPDLLTPSPTMLARERSPSLGSIEEEDGDREELLATLPEESSIDHSYDEAEMSQGKAEEEEFQNQKQEYHPMAVIHEVNAESSPSHPVNLTQSSISQEEQTMDGSLVEPEEVKLPTAPFVSDNAEHVGEQGEQTREIVSPENGPNITVQPATPGSSLKAGADDPLNKPIDTAKATAIEEENGRANLTSRKKPSPSPSPERPLTPTSVHSAGKDAKSRNFLKAFWRVVFVEWIGGFIGRMCGGGRHNT